MANSMLDRYNQSQIQEKGVGPGGRTVNAFPDTFQTGFTANRTLGDPTEFNMDEVQKRTGKDSPKYTDTPRF